MKRTARSALAAFAAAGSLLFLTAGCDKGADKDAADKAAASASAAAAAASAMAAAASAESAAASASAAPSGAPTKDMTVTVTDPKTVPAKTTKALVGGTVTLYLPEWPGTSWSIPTPDKALGKPKEENMPGFAGPVPAHAFTWTIKDKTTRKIQLVNKKKKPDGAPDTPFTLTIEPA